MPKQVINNLSALTIKKAKPGRYTDGNGLQLVVAPTGARKWVLRVVIHHKRCDIGLGGFPLVGLADAREKAAELRRLARAGGDPLAERRKERRVIPTFESAARQVHEQQSAAFRNPQHAAQWLATLNAYAFPVFGSVQVDRIESADVLKALSPIWLSKPETARRVRQRIKAVFDWTIAAGFRTNNNPVAGVTQVLPKHRDTKEHHAALPYKVLPEFLIELKAGDAGIAVKLAFEFMILTAARTSEALLARWSEIDMKAKTWTIPADRMKAHREHRVPLAARSLAVLREAAQVREGEFVFPGRTSKKPLSNTVFLMTLRRMNRGDLTGHGFRSSFRDWAAEATNFSREVCEAALAHTLKDKTEAAYNRTDLFEKRRALMEAWAVFATTKVKK